MLTRLFGKSKQAAGERTYGLKYTFKPEFGSFAKSEGDKKYTGLADAVVFISLVDQENGFSQALFSYDSRNEKRELSDEQLFGVWLTLGHRLANTGTLAKHLQAFCNVTLKSFREYMYKVNAANAAKAKPDAENEHDVSSVLHVRDDSDCASPVAPMSEH